MKIKLKYHRFRRAIKEYLKSPNINIGEWVDFTLRLQLEYNPIDLHIQIDKVNRRYIDSIKL